jgi:hypothetical protein
VFLTISTTGSAERPATDLGFLLHKHPEKAQAFSTSYGTAHVLYPEADAERCTAALLLEVDAVALVRRGKGKGRGGAPDAALAQYVNDRPYAASSLLAVALSGVFSSAMRGLCTARPELPTGEAPESRPPGLPRVQSTPSDVSTSRQSVSDPPKTPPPYRNAWPLGALGLCMMRPATMPMMMENRKQIIKISILTPRERFTFRPSPWWVVGSLRHAALSPTTTHLHMRGPAEAVPTCLGSRCLARAV